MTRYTSTNISFLKKIGEMRRVIEGFHLDDEGEWVADLSCHHSQHVRHNPPWQEREWVQDDSTRNARIGTEIECRLCDE